MSDRRWSTETEDEWHAAYRPVRSISECVCGVVVKRWADGRQEPFYDDDPTINHDECRAQLNPYWAAVEAEYTPLAVVTAPTKPVAPEKPSRNGHASGQTFQGIQVPSLDD